MKKKKKQNNIKLQSSGGKLTEHTCSTFWLNFILCYHASTQPFYSFNISAVYHLRFYSTRPPFLGYYYYTQRYYNKIGNLLTKIIKNKSIFLQYQKCQSTTIFHFCLCINVLYNVNMQTYKKYSQIIFIHKIFFSWTIWDVYSVQLYSHLENV